MRVLLDTHAFLWWLDGDRRLSTRSRRTVGNEDNTVLISAASAWEIATKFRIGKLPGAAEVAMDISGWIIALTDLPPVGMTILAAKSGWARVLRQSTVPVA